ncbi:nucleoside/nucleotide kinase family protein [Paracoccus albus]|uniref:nucleoside/nucleotide kinase family protein n=1 Tax=Paracoccus albus TaxID=3017784 RepID=UPI0022EFF9C9|nr:nucleoside/nucleotide kinase family protein [Paracoccus albus]WBU61699.1 nucleoside/nucleotide kinase family protein [Paracoccus albus]
MSERTDRAGLLSWLGALPSEKRRIVAIAGAPASGKSTLAEWLNQNLSASAILPMDGFHYDDAVLDAWGLRQRKGAPPTFDVDGLGHMLSRLVANDGRDVAVPVFDRKLEISRAGARIIGPDVRLILCEGNYLLLDDPAWRPLSQHFDLTVMVEGDLAEIEARLQQRWLGQPDGPEKVRLNDLPNARLVIQNSLPADVILSNR